MACIKSAARSALVAFAPDAPYLAAGTMAGAVDLSFSSSATLEIFKLDFQSDAHELPVAGACPSVDRFNRLSWGKPPGSASEDYALGLVAGGLGDGSIGVWNPLKLISSEDQGGAFVAKLENHVGPVRGLEFSSLSSNLLASGADEGELCIWDLAKPSEPSHFPSLRVHMSLNTFETRKNEEEEEDKEEERRKRKKKGDEEEEEEEEEKEVVEKEERRHTSGGCTVNSEQRAARGDG
ncbi:hypothetical protein B296_00038663 [Ensete ventricosum]|uniref:Uncharacterized protein n=1 Tax=Ensete ventricosum TaxID=4639 RepID=A0A426ZFY2_ENSVE|nr:hypothetical protein B296_00038663 [Ensete ventricosum]